MALTWIEEGTVEWLGDARVPMGNVRLDRYALPDGTEVLGPVCALAVNGPVVVGAGSVLELDGVAWRVVAVGLREGDRPGCVALEPA